MLKTKKTFTFKSSSGLCDIFAASYLPDSSVKTKGIIQISHGMAEHHERYEDFIDYLTSKGYAVYINDHLGHGKSVSDDSQLGFFGRKAGYIYLVDDMKILSDIAKKEMPDIPLILFGHSMGSFLARLYSEKYGSNIDGAVYCGTSGANPAAPLGISIIRIMISIKGDHYRSQFINKLAFGSYNKKIKNPRTAFDWLSTRTDIVDKYVDDPYCGFLFTTCGYKDLMNLLMVVNRPEWYTSVPAGLPIYLISGAEDPVGNYGKGVKEVYNNLIDSKHTDVSMKLFPHDRHEILNEENSPEVYKNITDWIESII